MKVVDADVMVRLVAADFDPDLLGDEELAAPHLIDSEVTHALRGRVLRNAITTGQGGEALTGFTAQADEIRRGLLRPRVWAYRHNSAATTRRMSRWPR